jgi:hypothetical protein
VTVATSARLDRVRLGRVVALFDSPAEGERTAALEAANRLLQAAGVRWRDLVGANGLDLDDDDAAEIFRRARASTPADDDGEDHRALCARLLREGRAALTRWEADFLRGMIGFARVSAAQQKHLDEIGRKVETARRYWQAADGDDLDDGAHA